MSRKSQITIFMISHEASITGAPLFLKYLTKGFSKENFRVVVFFSEDGPIIGQMKKEGFEIFYSKKRPRKPNIASLIIYRFLHYIKLINLLLRTNPDIVYSNTIVNCGEVILCKIFCYPILMHMHEGENYAKKMRYKLFIETLFCDLIFVGSDYARRVLLSLTGVNGVVVTTGISRKKISSSMSFAKRPIIRLGMLGSIEENKGQLLALTTIALAKSQGIDLQLKIAGATSNKNYKLFLNNFIHTNKLENHVEFLGYIKSTDEIFNVVDILLVCSYDEVFPTVILEAMREKKLVIATRVGGIPEIIEHGATGFLFQAGNSCNLLECLQLAMEEETTRKIIEKAHMEFLRLYDIEIITIKISRLIYSFIKKNSSLSK